MQIQRNQDVRNSTEMFAAKYNFRRFKYNRMQNLTVSTFGRGHRNAQ